MQYFKKDMKKIFQVQEFHIAHGATSRDSQLAPSKFNPWGASGQLLISNTEIIYASMQFPAVVNIFNVKE